MLVDMLARAMCHTCVWYMYMYVQEQARLIPPLDCTKLSMTSVPPCGCVYNAVILAVEKYSVGAIVHVELVKMFNVVNEAWCRN